MRFVKYLFVFLVLSPVAVYFFVVNFSASESRYKCPGHWHYSAGTEPTEIFLKLEDYAWWVGLWSDSEGTLYWEIPNEQVGYFTHLEGREMLRIYHELGGNIQGTFSVISNNLILQVGTSQFMGTCEAI